MPTLPDYLQKNKHSWNERTNYHINSAFYNLENFIKGQTSLNDIELYLLGDIAGKKILHLQCHFGQDTISLSRLGAKVTGVDFSDNAIARAHELAKKTGADVQFICCDLYDLPAHLDEQFDMVFTSYGTIGWLPDMDKWARLISTYLRSGGRLVFVEFHPVVWMFDDSFAKVGHNYFNEGPIIEIGNGTYAEKDAPIATETVCWNHSMSEVVNSLLLNGLTINSFDEFDYSPYNCFQETVECSPGKFRIKHLDNKIPMVYSLSATKQ
jgi:ubiquinone/menaquinone biosynthesis C-methylase UbiE